MNIFVTGGSGFVGRHLIQLLIKSGHKVWALARSKSAENAVRLAGATPVQGSLENIPRWSGALAQCEVVIHAASTVEHWGSWSFFESQMVTPTEELLNVAEQQSVRRFIFISSESALNNSSDLIDVDETAPYPTKHNSYYAKGKCLAEKSILAHKGNIETIILRPPFIWGADSPFLVDICERARKNQFPWIDQGNSLFDQVHVDNLCQAIHLACTKGSSGQIYFVTDDHPLTLREFFSAIFVQLGITLPGISLPRWMLTPAVNTMMLIWKPLPIKPPLARFELDFLTQSRRFRIDKAKQELGYQPANFAMLLQTLRH